MTEQKKIAIITGIAAAVYLGMKYILPYVIPFFAAYLLVRLLNPVILKLQNIVHWKKQTIMSILLVILLLLCSSLFYIFYCQLLIQIRRIAVNLDLYYNSFSCWVEDCCCMVERNFGVGVNEVRTFVYAQMDQVAEQVRVYIVPGVLNYSVRYLKKLVNAGAFLLMLFVAVILLTKDYDEMHEKLQNYQIYRHVHNITERVWQQGGKYMRAQGVIILSISILCMAGLWAIGNPFFLVLGLVIGLTDALPFIGTGTVLVPMAGYYLIRGRYPLALGYLGLFLLTYFAREFMEPRLIGEKLGIYPIVMVIVVYAGLYLFGPSGVVLGPVSLLLSIEIWKEIQKE